MNLKCLLLACGSICQLTLAAAFTPEEARRVYGESSLDFTSSAAREVGDYVFMELRWTIDADTSTDDRDAKELSETLAALRKYVTPESVACTNSPFGKALTSWLMPEPVFNVPEVDRCILKDEEKGGERCQVVAFEASPLKAAKTAAAKEYDVNSRSREDWLAHLKNAYANFNTPKEKRKFNVMLGCPIVNYILCSGTYCEENVNDDEKAGVAEVEKIANWKPAKDSVFSEYPNLLWTTHKNGQSNFYPAWREDDGGKFAEADVLYRKGKDVPMILVLLAESISVNPIGEKKWAYLGGVLKALNKPEDAMIAYIQTLKFNKDNPWAWKGVHDCCKKLGMESNAAGLGWYLKLNGIE